MKMALLTSSPPGFRSARKRSYSIAATAVLLFLTPPVTGAETPSAAGTAHSNDPHYTAAGFFDIHVCNWPDRELFFMPLFSTTRYSEITAIEVRHPDGKRLTALDLGNFMVLKP